MKPTYSGFEAKKSGNFITLPPAGAYVAEIRAVRVKESGDGLHDVIELMMEIVEGEYANRYTEVYNSQKERFGDAKYKGIFRLTPPIEGEEDWRKRIFEGNLWCVEQSNSGYTWDWDEKKLQGKKVGISVRNRFYTYNGKDYESTEIGQFETVQDVRDKKVKPMKDRDQRTGGSEESTDGSNFTDVSKSVNVPW